MSSLTEPDGIKTLSLPYPYPYSQGSLSPPYPDPVVRTIPSLSNKIRDRQYVHLGSGMTLEMSQDYGLTLSLP